MKIAAIIGLGITALLFVFTRWGYDHRVFLSNKADSPSVSPNVIMDMHADIRYALRNFSPVMGHRFVVFGDFDGDHQPDTLVEHYISMLDMKETNKFYADITDYGDLVEMTRRKEPQSIITCSSANIDTLFIAHIPQLLGLAYVKNEGDLDGDGNDELSFLVDWADWSTLNTYYIVSFKKGKWVKLYSFDVWDWQFPALPDFPTVYGLFGTDQVIALEEKDSTNILIKQNLQDFPGLIRKQKTNIMEVVYRDSDNEMTTGIIDLRRERSQPWLRL